MKAWLKVNIHTGGNQRKRPGKLDTHRDKLKTKSKPVARVAAKH